MKASEKVLSLLKAGLTPEEFFEFFRELDSQEFNFYISIGEEARRLCPDEFTVQDVADTDCHANASILEDRKGE